MTTQTVRVENLIRVRPNFGNCYGCGKSHKRAAVWEVWAWVKDKRIAICPECFSKVYLVVQYLDDGIQLSAKVCGIYRERGEAEKEASMKGSMYDVISLDLAR